MTAPHHYDDYQERLRRERKELLAKLAAEEQPADFGSDVEDSDSTEADEAEDMANRLSIAQATRDRLVEIDEALAAIENKTYGTCTKCGGAIAKEILDLVPESRLCGTCKQR